MDEEPFGMVAGGATVVVIVAAIVGFAWVLAAAAAVAVVVGIIWLIVHLVRKGIAARAERQSIEFQMWNKLDAVNEAERDFRMEVNDIVGESWRNKFER